MTRLAAQDMTLGPATIKAGTLIVIPIFAVHRHRKLWEDPDRFDPARFAPEREAKYARTQFMPFGFGPRTCIGGTFAMMEGTAILATLVRRARFEWDGVHAPEPISRVTLEAQGRHAVEGLAARVDCATARRGLHGRRGGQTLAAASDIATPSSRGLTPFPKPTWPSVPRATSRSRKKNRRAMPRKKLTRIRATRWPSAAASRRWPARRERRRRASYFAAIATAAETIAAPMPH